MVERMSSGSTDCGSFVAKMSARPRFARASQSVRRRRLALEALPGLARRGGNSAPQICSREQAEQEIEAAYKLGVSLVALGEADYPQRLQMIDDAPPLVALRGHTGVFGMPLLAIAAHATLQPPA